MHHTSPDNTAYLYDGSVEGLLTAVFKTYEHKEHPVDLCPIAQHQPRLGQEIRIIETDIELALRVQRGICRTAGYTVFNVIKTAALADEPTTGISVYHFIRYCMDERNAADFHRNKKGEALPNSKLTDAGCGPALLKGSAAPAILHPSVEPVLKLERFVQNERHHIIQFLRFEELEGGLWCARCNPKASVVPLIMDWFSARFNIQPFVIYDENHHVAGIYEGADWHLFKTDTFTPPPLSENERVMQDAWKRFYDTLTIEARYNPELRRQFMPKRFWKNITEVKDMASA